MRNALIKKIIFISCIYLLNLSFTVGQDVERELPVKVGQLTDSWCWAACIEMIIKYHDPTSTITQCSLVVNYMQLSTYLTSSQKQKIRDGDYCCPICTEDGLISADPNAKCTAIGYTKTIDFFTGTDNPALPHYGDLLFASLGYNSIEELNGVYGTLGEVDGKPVEYKMPWNAVKKEIDEGRPFIVIMATPVPVLGATATATGRPAKPSTSHLVIVNGYAPATGITDYDKIIIHDPWLPLCTGSSAYVPYGVFNTSATTYSVTSPITYNFNQVLGVIHGIQKKDNIIGAKVASIQNTPEPEPPKNSFTSVFRENAERIIGSKQERYSDAEITSKVKQEAYYRNEVQFIYPSALLNSRFNLHLNAVVAPNQILDVVSTGVLPNFVTTFEKEKDLWAVKKITNFSYLVPGVKIKINKNKDEITLSNIENKDFMERAIPYRLVKYPPFLYEFYSFRYEGKNYMTPVLNYPEFKMQAGTAYKEKTVLRCLFKETKEYKKAKYRFDNIIGTFGAKNITDSKELSKEN